LPPTCFCRHPAPWTPWSSDVGRTPYDLADIIRRHREALERRQPLSPVQGRALSAIALCRTAALGGHVDVCPACGHQEEPSYNSCRNRHCPKCQNQAQERWIADRARALLPVPHFHGVVTLPEDLRAVARRHPREVYAALFRCASEAFLELGRSRLGATLGLTLVLHTWTRDLRLHPHVHVLVTAGGLTLNGSAFKRCRERFLLPKKPLALLFKGKLMDALRGLHAKGLLGMTEGAFGSLMASLARQTWVVYLKRAFRSPDWVLAYLGRYTHRVGIANSRFLQVTDEAITFRTKDGRSVTLPPVTFLQRFIQHVLPERFKKIRHAGLYAAPQALAEARGLLQPATAAETTPNPREPDPRPPNVCQTCGTTLHTLLLQGLLRTLRGTPSQAARRPP